MQIAEQILRDVKELPRLNGRARLTGAADEEGAMLIDLLSVKVTTGGAGSLLTRPISFTRNDLVWNLSKA
jgi:hypothetical protein